MRPANDFILVKPIMNDQNVKGVQTPYSADFLTKAEVIDIGDEMCVLYGRLIVKCAIVPGLQVGAIVHFLKMAQDRMTENAALSVRSKGEYLVLVSIQDIRAIDDQPEQK